LKLLDLFSGIGGFHKGFEQAGFTFDWVGFSEIDKYASSVYKYKFPKSEELGDITTIRPENLPKDIDILCGGFPCQTFSIAGKRAGFNDTRGTLFFEIARILRYFRDIEKPIPYFILENVKGLLNHDNGRTFNTIYGVLTDLDYTVECQLLNTRWFLPQNRERIYLVGHFGKGSGSKIFPIGEVSKQIDESQPGVSQQVSSTIFAGQHKISRGMTMIDTGLNQIGTIGKDSEATRVYDTTCARTIKNGGGMGAKTGLYMVKEATKKGYDFAQEGDSINLAQPNSKTRRGRVGKGEANTLDTQMQQHTIVKSNIRRLTPTECERLQGFSDGWTTRGILDDKVVDMSDTQRYKQLGNAVTVNVVQAVAERIGEIK
jgi:DNA (cytosine-5)-methyltransferase 1